MKYKLTISKHIGRKQQVLNMLVYKTNKMMRRIYLVQVQNTKTVKSARSQLSVCLETQLDITKIIIHTGRFNQYYFKNLSTHVCNKVHIFDLNINQSNQSVKYTLYKKIRKI